MELFGSNDSSLWRASLAGYSKVLALKEAEKKRKKGKKLKAKDEGLVQLDKWYQQTLPELVSSRESPHLKHAELSKLMKWKLTRGKFRPRLGELVQQNHSDEVEKVTREAFQMVPTNLEGAVKHLCQLKAVGPATASAILCAGCPRLVPFMADEAVSSVPGLGKIEYTLRHYMAYTTKVQEKVEQLNISEGKAQAGPWTCHDAELALWAFQFAKKFDFEFITPNKETVPNEEVEDDCPDADDEEGSKPEAKRMKLEQEQIESHSL